MEEEIRNLLRSTNRPGIENLINFLQKNAFFVAPASINHHLNYTGGLAEHSLNVYKQFKRLRNEYKLDIPEENMIISGILHDVCKIDDYTKEVTNKPTEKQVSFLNNLVDQNNKVLKNNIDDLGKSQVSELISWLVDNPSEDEPVFEDYWDYNNEKEYPFEHGEKSVFMISQFINLKKREMLAIRYHMGAWEKNLNYKNHNRAKEMFPDIKLIAIADEISTFKEDWDI